MASHRHGSKSLSPTLTRQSTYYRYEYSSLPGPRATRLLFIESQSRDYTRHFITGRLELVSLEDFERKHVALSYTWGPAIREEYIEPEDSSQIMPSYELLIAADLTADSVDDCDSHDESGTKSRPARGYTTIKLAPNLSDYFTYHAEWHIKERVPIWIDAICINQQDPLEFADQILLQADIYTMAKQTNVWLGACLRDLSTFEWWQDAVYQAIGHECIRNRLSPYMFDLMFKTGNHLDAQFWLRNLGIAPPNGTAWYDCWKSYVDFFFIRRWFARLWTIQEGMLAQKVYMICGPRTFNFNDVLHLDRWLLSSYFRSKSTSEISEDQAERLWPRWNPGHIFEIIRTRIDHVQQGAFSDTIAGVSALMISYLLGILQSARGHETTLSRDKVLGLLGVAAHFVPKDELQLLVGEPGSSDLEVFVSFARYFVHRGCLDILSYAGHRQSPAHSSWPSWVPDWNDVSQRGFYDSSLFTAGDRSSEVRSARAPHVDSSNANWEGIFAGSIPRVLGETLVLYGVPVGGAVAETYAKDEWTQHFGSFLALLGPTYFLTGEPIHDALLRTIFRDTSDDPSVIQRVGADDIHLQFLQYLRMRLVRTGQANPHFARDLEALLLSQPSMHSSLSLMIHDVQLEVNMFERMETTTSSQADPEVGIPAQQSSAVQQSFSNEVEIMQKVFNIFVTTDGVLGNGSKSIKPGHEIWVVENGPVPAVLERGMNGRKFRLISTAYVHGVMYGEARRSEGGQRRK